MSLQNLLNKCQDNIKKTNTLALDQSFPELSSLLSTLPNESVVITPTKNPTIENSVLTISGTTAEKWNVFGLPKENVLNIADINLCISATTDTTFAITVEVEGSIAGIPIIINYSINSGWKLSLGNEFSGKSLEYILDLAGGSNFIDFLPAGDDVFKSIQIDSLDIKFDPKQKSGTNLSLTISTAKNSEWDIIIDVLTLKDISFDFHAIHENLGDGSQSSSFGGNIAGLVDIDGTDFKLTLHVDQSGDFEIDITPDKGKSFPGLEDIDGLIDDKDAANAIKSGLKELGLDNFSINDIKIGCDLYIRRMLYLCIGAELKLNDNIRFDISAWLPDFKFSGSLSEGCYIGLSDIFSCCSLPAGDMPDLDIKDMVIRAEPKRKEYSLDVEIEEDCSFEIAGREISLTELSMNIDHDGMLKTNTGKIVGRFNVAGVDLSMSAEHDDKGWIFQGSSKTENSLSLSSFLNDLFGSENISLPASIDSFTLADIAIAFNSATKDLSFSGSIQDIFKINTGNISLELDEVVIAIDHVQGKTAGSLQATASIGDNSFDLNWDLKGDFVFKGTLPQISLKDLAENLCGSFIDLPADFPQVEFKDSDIQLIEKQNQTDTAGGKEFEFSLTSILDQLGSKKFETAAPLAFVVQKKNAHTGFEAGFDLPDSWSPADMWSVFGDIFQDLSFRDVGLLISSLDSPSVSLGNLQDKKIPVNIYAGVTFFATLDFKGVLLSQLKKLFAGVDDLSINALIAKDPKQTKIVASLGGQKAGKNSMTFDGVQLVFMPGAETVDFSCGAAFKIKDDVLDFKANAALSLTGNVTFDLSMKGQNGKESSGWVNPFGISGITIDGLGLSIGFDEEGCLVAFEGKIELGDKKDGIILDIGASVVDFLLPGSIVAELEPQSPKKGKITISGLVDSLTDIDLGKVPLLNDIILKDFKFYLIDDPTGFKSPIDPTFVYKPGTTIIADVAIFGLEASMDMEVSQNKGIYAKGYLSEVINLMDVLVISDKSGKKGAHGFIDTSAVSDSGAGDYINISGLISLFNIQKEALKAKASKEGFIFSLEYDVAGIDDMKIDCCLKESKAFSAKGSAKIGVDKSLNIGVCHIHLKDYVITTLGLSLDKKSFTMKVEAAIDIAGEKVSFGFTIDEKFSDLKDLAEKTLNYLEEHAEDIFKHISADLDKLLRGAEKGVINLGKDFAHALKNTYKKAGKEAVKVLKDVGYGVKEVGDALNSVYKYSGKHAAKILKDVKYAAKDVGKALKSAYKYGGKEAAKALKYAGYGAKDVGKALKSAYNFGGKEAAKALKYAGYGAKDVGNALKSAYDFGGKEAAKALKYAGYGAKDVKKALSYSYHKVKKAYHKVKHFIHHLFHW